MKRVLEPELMDDAAQARAYAKADFAEENHKQSHAGKHTQTAPPGASGLREP